MSKIPTNHYPRSVPLQQVEVREAQQTRLRRWTVLLAGASAVLLVILVMAAVVLLNSTGPVPASAAAHQAAPAPAPKEAKLPDPPAKDVKPAASPSGPSVAALTTRSERLLESLGALSAAHLYQNFLNIGLLADGVENETYTQAEALKMLNTVTGLMDMVDGHLQKLKDAGLDTQDLKSVENIRTLTGLLRTQATALRIYWASGEQEQVVRYHTAREEAWAGLSELLGVQEKTP